MALPVSGVLDLADREKILEPKAIELAKPPPATSTWDKHTPCPIPPQNVGSFITAATGGDGCDSQGANSSYGGGNRLAPGGI